MDDLRQSIRGTGEEAGTFSGDHASTRTTSSRPIVLVLGMHRSGTSLCSHILSSLGVNMTDQIAGPNNPGDPDPSNGRGHWERWAIVEFHERLLSLLKRNYHGPFHDLPFPVAWWADPRVVQVRREIVAAVETQLSETLFGFKDPRTIRFLPIWLQIFAELNLEPRFVLCLRSPSQVARSLQVRDGLPVDVGEYRWFIHMIDFFRYAINMDFCTIEYETWFNDPVYNTQKLRKFINLLPQQSQWNTELEVSSVIAPSLRHDAPSTKDADEPHIRSLYKLARVADQDSVAREQAEALARQFTEFQQLQYPISRSLEQIEARRSELEAQQPRVGAIERERDEHAAALVRAEQEATELRQAISEGQQVVAAFQERVATSEARVSEALAELQERRSRVAKIECERDERAAALALVEQKVIELRRAASESECALAAVNERATISEAHLAKATRRIDRLSVELSERDEALQAINARAHSGEQELAVAWAENEYQRNQIADFSRQRDELSVAIEQVRRDAESQRLESFPIYAEAIRLRLVVARAEKAAMDKGAGAEILQEELEMLHKATAKTEAMARNEVADLQARIDELEGALTDTTERATASKVRLAEALAKLDELAGELARRNSGANALNAKMSPADSLLAAALAQDERESQTHSIVEVQTESEITDLRETMAQAAREVQDYAASAEVLRAEVARLGDQLIAARVAGRAAVSALRLATKMLRSASFVPPHNRWWRFIRRLVLIRAAS